MEKTALLKSATLLLLAAPVVWLLIPAGRHFEWDGQISLMEALPFVAAAYMLGWLRGNREAKVKTPGPPPPDRR